MTNKLQVAVIGAGAAGLCAARYATQSGHQVTIYEQIDEIGGNWVYSDRIGNDDYGLKIHTSMYKNLCTNLPEQLMEFPGFSMPPDSNRSFVPWEKISNYLRNFADNFDLKKSIKFRHHVIRVRPIETTRWEIIVKDLPNDHVDTVKYDAVFVCNGHCSTPLMPDIPGMDRFKGVQKHSHDFRDPQKYKDKNVLIIGGGSSGIELCTFIERAANSVTLSCREPVKIKTMKLSDRILVKGIVVQLTESGVVFEDGNQEMFDTIIYCTGYKYSYPFLSIDCDIQVDNKFVYPLYQQCINVLHPTMYFIGVPSMVCLFSMLDLQARYCMKFLNNDKSLPSTAEMFQSVENHIAGRRAEGIPKRKWHKLGILGQREYFEKLAKEADITGVPDVFDRIFASVYKHAYADISTFRNYLYTILDDDHFEAVILEK